MLSQNQLLTGVQLLALLSVVSTCRQNILNDSIRSVKGSLFQSRQDPPQSTERTTTENESEMDPTISSLTNPPQSTERATTENHNMTMDQTNGTIRNVPANSSVLQTNVKKPVTMIWRPLGDNKFGHAAIQTNKYHISFWPDGNVKQELGVWNAANNGVPGAIVYHQEYDAFLEGIRTGGSRQIKPRKPDAIYELQNVESESIERIYEEFLRYNNIEPETVTLTEGRKMLDQRNPIRKSLSKTRYSFLPWLIIDKEENLFYEKKQSCVSFAFNLVETADPDLDVSNMKLEKLFGKNFMWNPFNSKSSSKILNPWPFLIYLAKDKIRGPISNFWMETTFQMEDLNFPVQEFERLVQKYYTKKEKTIPKEDYFIAFVKHILPLP